jgi:lipopolysaccharide export system permease protein
VKLIDRYIFAQTWRNFAAICGIIVALLLLENLSRLLHLLENVEEPISLLLQFLLALVPEYLGLGILVAIFLSTALAVRSLSLAGEWQILAATGVSPTRLLLIPMMFGAVGATAETAINFHYRPVGERRLDQLLDEVRLGRHGVGAAIRSIVSFPNGVTVTIDGHDRATGMLTGVFVAMPEVTLTAPRARATHDGFGTIVLRLENGRGLTRRRDGFNVLSFRYLTVRIATTNEKASTVSLPALDRLPLDEIVELAMRETSRSQTSMPALASIASRLTYSLMALVVPILGIALGAPPMRGRSGAGLVLGILMIVGFVRAASFVESSALQRPVLASGVLMLLSGGAAGLLWRFEIRSGPGFVDRLIDRQLVSPLLYLAKGKARTTLKVWC